MTAMTLASEGWILSLLGQLVGGRGRGVQNTIEHSWPFVPWLTALFLLGACAFVVLIYLRERASVSRGRLALMIGLRLGVIGLLLLMMYGWMRYRHVTDLPDLVVIMDASQSMAIADRYSDSVLDEDLRRSLQELKLSDSTRINIAKALLLQDDERLLKSLAMRYNLKLYQVGDSARVQSVAPNELSTAIRAVEAEEAASQLGDGLRDVLESQRGRHTAGIVMFTDGITTEGTPLSDAADYARRKQIPLFLIGLGNEQPPRDVALTDLLVDDVVFVGDTVHFDFKLATTGLTKQSVVVRLRQKDAPGVLDQKTVALAAMPEALSVRLTHRPPAEGDYEYIVEAVPLAGEVNVENNSQSALVSVRDATIRVLLVQEYPSFEFRYLKTLLERSLKSGDSQGEKAIELTTVLQEADPEYAEQDATARRVFPVQRDELFQYDVLVFGDVNPSFLSNSVMTNIADFVKERGGGVIFLSGPRHTPLGYRKTPLEELLPVVLESTTAPDLDALLSTPFKITPTALGISSPQMQLADTVAVSRQVWSNLPPGYWMLQPADLRPGVLVLAEASPAASTRSYPAISMQFIGAGKVIFHGFDESYRWSRFRGSDRYYQRYWLQTIRFLSRSKLLGQTRGAELTTDRDEYRRGDTVRLRVRFFDDRLAPAEDDGVTIVLKRDEGKRRMVQLRRSEVTRGIFEATISDLVEGQYRAWLAAPVLEGEAPARRFAVTAPPGEHARLEMNASELRSAARATDGRFYTVADADRLTRDLPPGRQVRIESLPPEPIWNSSWLASLFVAMLVSEWLLRKRAGLL